MLSRATASLLLISLLAVFGRAVDPASAQVLIKDFQADMTHLSPAVGRLRAGIYGPEDHAATSAALRTMNARATALKAALPELKRAEALSAALTAASAKEEDFWAGERSGAAAQALAERLASIPEDFTALFQALSLQAEAALSSRLSQQGVPITASRQNMAERATALDAALKSGDPESVGRLLDGIFKDSRGYTAGALAEAVRAHGQAAAPKAWTGASKLEAKGLMAKDVPLTEAKAAGPLVGGIKLARIKEAALLGLDNWPAKDVIDPQLAAEGRERRLRESCAAAGQWLANVGGPRAQALLKDLAAAQGLPAGARDSKLAEFLPQTARLLDDSPTGAASAGLQALQKKDPAYFKARGLWAQYVAFNRDNLARFSDGTQFTFDELGLPADMVPADTVAKSSRLGQPGLKYLAKNGLSHFQTLDGRLTLDEMLVNNRSFFIENRSEGGKLLVATYDGKMNQLDAQTYEPAEGGRFVTSSESRPWPRTTGRFKNGRFAAERMDNEDGSAQVLVKTAPGLWELLNKSKNPAGWSLDPGLLVSPDDQARDSALAEIARHVAGKLYPGADSAYRADCITAFLKASFRHRPEGAVQAIFDSEGKVVINEFLSGAGSVRQTLAKFEPTGTGRPAYGKLTEGLSVYVRKAASTGDQSAPFTRLFQYLGTWGMERFSSRTESNSERWYWWIVGPSVQETPRVQRLYRQPDGTYGKGDLPVEKEIVTLYSGSGIVGATGRAVAIAGKGAADLAGSAFAYGLAASPGYYALVKATGGDAAYAAQDMLERGRVNFFNNAISTELGELYGGERYREGKDALDLDETRSIQNVGKEMSDMGHHTTGAVLQGGINVANNTAPMLLNLKGLQVIGQLGNTGRVISAGTGIVYSGVGGWQAGTAANQFGTALADYDEGNPLSKARYHASITDLTEQGLNLPMLLGGLKQVYARGKSPAGTRTPLLGETINAKEALWDPVVKLPSGLTGLSAQAAAPFAALDARIPGWIGSLPGGSWLARELDIELPQTRPAEPTARTLAEQAQKLVADKFSEAPESYRTELAAHKAPQAEVLGVLSEEGSSAVLLDAQLGGMEVAVKTYKPPIDFTHESQGKAKAWGHTIDYFHEELRMARAMQNALGDQGLAPKVFGEVDVGKGGDPSWAMERIRGKIPEQLTPTEIQTLITPETLRQAAEGVERLKEKGLGGGDSPQAMILTEPQLINGVPRHAGDVVFMDPGGLTTHRSIWQTPEDMAKTLAFNMARGRAYAQSYPDVPLEQLPLTPELKEQFRNEAKQLAAEALKPTVQAPAAKAPRTGASDPPQMKFTPDLVAKSQKNNDMGHGAIRHSEIPDQDLMARVAKAKGAPRAATRFSSGAELSAAQKRAWDITRRIAAGDQDIEGLVKKDHYQFESLLAGKMKITGFEFEMDEPVGYGYILDESAGMPAPIKTEGIRRVYAGFGRHSDGTLFIKTIYPKYGAN